MILIHKDGELYLSSDYMLSYKLTHGYTFIKHIPKEELQGYGKVSGSLKEFIDKQQTKVDDLTDELIRRNKMLKKLKKLQQDYMPISLTKQGKELVDGILKN